MKQQRGTIILPALLAISLISLMVLASISMASRNLKSVKLLEEHTQQRLIAETAFYRIGFALFSDEQRQALPQDGQVFNITLRNYNIDAKIKQMKSELFRVDLDIHRNNHIYKTSRLIEIRKQSSLPIIFHATSAP